MPMLELSLDTTTWWRGRCDEG